MKLYRRHSKEFLRNGELARKFRVIDKTENIYQKIE